MVMLSLLLYTGSEAGICGNISISNQVPLLELKCLISQSIFRLQYKHVTYSTLKDSVVSIEQGCTNAES